MSQLPASSEATSVSSSPPAKKRRWLWGTVIAFLALAAFVVWILSRGGETVERPLIALLPADTPMAMQIHRLGDLLEFYDTTPLADLLANDIEIGALLLNQDAYRDWIETHREAELRSHLSLGRDFLLNWMGREVTLAYIYAPGLTEPCLVVLTQAELGFKERLAELVAQLIPGTRIVTEEYRGTTITSWVASEPRHSISLCRFGETVALSLRSDSTAHLRTIIDAVNAETPPEQPVFPPPHVPGIHTWVSAERLPHFLRAIPSEDMDLFLDTPEGQEFLHYLAQLDEIRLRYTVDSPRTLTLEMRGRDGAIPHIAIDNSWLGLTHADTLGLIHLAKPVLWWQMAGHLLFDLTIDIDPDWSPERQQRHLAKREWRVRLGHWMRDEVMPLLDGQATFVLDSIIPRIGLPALQAALVWETSQPERLEEVLHLATSTGASILLEGIDGDYIPDWISPPAFHRTIGDIEFPVWETPLGNIGYCVQDSRLIVTMQVPGSGFTARLLSGWRDSIADHPARQSVTALWGSGERIGEVYLHAKPLSQLSAIILMDPSMWTESGRRNLQRVRLANNFFALYPSVGIALQQSDDSLRLVLAFARSDEAQVTAEAE